MATMLDQLDQLEREAHDALNRVNDAEALERFRIEYLGSKGRLKSAMSWLKDAPKDEKPRLGQGLNALKKELEAGYERKKAEIGAPAAAARGPTLDVTEPGLPPRLGRVHVISQVMDQLNEVFARMGFDVAEGPEIEDERHNFVALNIPPEHPARDPIDNFYLTDPDGAARPSGGESAQMLRSQTSTVQIRVMERTQPPLRIIAPGRVYRPDTHDATHSSMFHQLEGLYVDRDVTMVDLKTTLLQFAHAMFGADAEVRLRPSYFPFTEPSAELDVKMKVRGEYEWMELGGCGMVDPAVFEAVGYDPEQWTGFAFGLGIERIAMRRYNIPDIRWLFENDIRFLRQF